MSLLSDEELEAIAGDGSNDDYHFARAIEAAILTKLASAELPEPLSMGSSVAGVFLDVYLPVHIQQAHAQGFAAGAASQLAEKPSGYLSQYNLEMLQQGYPQTIVMIEGAKRDVPLYTRREA